MDENKEYEIYFNNPYTELSIREFDTKTQRFVDVDLQRLWDYADSLNTNYQAINLVISHEDIYSFYKNNIIHTKNGINICGDCPDDFDHKDISGGDINIKVYFSGQTSEIMLGFRDWWGGWNECPLAEEMSGVIKNGKKNLALF